MIPVLSGIWEFESFLDVFIISLLCVLMVFMVLIVIALIMSLLNYIRALDEKEIVTMKNGQKLDEDAMAAILVASIDFRKETKEDYKVVSCELIDKENKK